MSEFIDHAELLRDGALVCSTPTVCSLKACDKERDVALTCSAGEACFAECASRLLELDVNKRWPD